MTEALTSNYWISPNAVRITLNAMGEKDHIQCGATGGAVIMCYMRDIDGLGYDAGHNYRRWPIVTAPVYFNSWTRKYVYIAIPRSTAVGTSAILVFPSKRIDLYGMTEPAEGKTEGEQIGSKDYYYIFLRGVISPSRSDGGADQLREWEEYVDYGTLSTDQQVSEGDSEWWRYNADDDTVTFLKVITNATFKVLNVLKNLTVGGDGLFGGSLSVAKDAVVGGLLTAVSAVINSIKSTNYSGSGMADTGWSITNDNGSGSSEAVFDYLTVRKKMTINSLEIKETHFTAGDICQSLATAEIVRTDYYYVDPDSGEMEKLGYSKYRVPWLLKGLALVLGKRAQNMKIFSRWKTVRINLTRNELLRCNRVRCYFLAKDGEREIENWWRENDLARCQTWNMTKAQRNTFIPNFNDHAGNIYWWRTVKNTSWNTGLPRYLLTDGDGNPKDPSDLSNTTTDPDNPNIYRNEAGLKYEVTNGTYNNEKGTQSYKDHQPAVIDGKTYHWIDIAFDGSREIDDNGRLIGDRTGWCDANSDIPAAGDKVVQFGNTVDPDRMNLMLWEVNGSGNMDAPDWKMYAGIYTFDLNLCWWGGTPQKTKWSYRTGIRVYAPKFEWITEYGIAKQAFDRGHWTELPLERDDDTRLHEDDLSYYPEYPDDIKNPDGTFKSRKNGEPRNFIRKCHYYDRVSHEGSMWLCSINETNYWVAKETFTTADHVSYSKGDRISNFSSLSTADKTHCEQVRSYTFDEPSIASLDWTEVVEKGDDGAFKSRVFCRSNTIPAAPSNETKKVGSITYNTFSNPVPPPVSGQPTWSDGAPNGTAILWSSTSWFYPNGTHTSWTSPAPETDTADLDIEFSPKYDQPLPPVGNAPIPDSDTSYKPGDATHASRSNGSGDSRSVWYDTKKDANTVEWDNMIWRAERKIKNGEYIGTWNISRIKGEQGDTPVTAYRWYKEGGFSTAPTAPTGETQDPTATDHISDGNAIPLTTWNHNAPNRPETGWCLYMTSSYRFDDGSYGAWTTPVRISGTDGTPGEDADNIEWIYKFDANGYNGNTGQVNPSAAASGSDTNKAQKGWVPNGWYDHAQGVTKDSPLLYASFRDITSDADNNKTYGAFQPPVIWSHFGRNGMDGDGFEYVFVRTITNTAPTIVVKSDSYTDSHGKKFTDDEFLPKALVNGSEVECLDDPQSVDPVNKYVWVAKRTKGSANADTGVRTWEKYSGTMALWNNWGENAVRLDLDNENDSMLYTGGGTLVSGNVETTGYLYDGMDDVSSQATWSIDSSSGCTATISGRKVTVTAMSATSGSVVVKAVYMDKEYKATLTLKKIVDGDKYDLVITPNSIAYNATTDTPATSTLNIQVWKISVNNSGGATRALSAPPSGYNVYAGTTQLTASSTGTYSHTTDNSAINEVLVKIAKSAASTDVLDAETVPVNKSENGQSVTKSGPDTYRYAIGTSGITPPTSGWSTSRPSTFDKDKWLWTETTIHWSNNTETVLYTNERNPNDGIAGQDIIVDGPTVMQYSCKDSNTVNPATINDWADYGSVTKVKGWWLWSKATTNYKKATDGSFAGSSINYNVSYIATDGRGLTTFTEYYKATNSSDPMQKPTSDTGWDTDPNLSAQGMDPWNESHKYLWNYEKAVYSNGDVERTIPQIVAIWTKNGRGIDSITNLYCLSNSIDDVPIKRGLPGADTWEDDPMTPALGQVLWNYEIIEYTDGTSDETEVQAVAFGGDVISNAQAYKAFASDTAPSSTDKPTPKTNITIGSTNLQNGWEWNPIASSGQIIYSSTAVLKNGNVQGDWSSPTQWSGKDGSKGDKGDNGTNGKDGWTYEVSNDSVHIDQDLDNENLWHYPAAIMIRVLKGNTVCYFTVSSVTCTQDGGYNIIGWNGAGTSGVNPPSGYPYLSYNITINSVISGTATKGVLTVNMSIYDPDTQQAVSHTAKINFCINRLGYVKTTVKGDVETTVARKLYYGYSGVDDPYATLDAVATYVRSAEEYEQRLVKSVGTNLFQGLADGEGWQDGDGGDMLYNSQNYNCEGNGDIFSPLVYLSSGYYVLSYYNYKHNSDNAYLYCDDNDLDNIDIEPYELPNWTNLGSPTEDEDDEISVVYGGSTIYPTRHYWVFQIANNGYYSINFHTTRMWRPQLERCDGSDSVPTNFVGTSAVQNQSLFKQTSDSIDLSVTSKLGEAGINIAGSDRSVNLYADKVKFYKNKASATAGDPAKIWIDGGDGSLHAVDGNFSGRLVVKRMVHTTLDEDVTTNLSLPGTDEEYLVDTYYCAADNDITIDLRSLESLEYQGIELTFINKSESRVKLRGNYFCYTIIDNGNLTPHFTSANIYVPGIAPPVKLMLVQNNKKGWGFTWYVISGIVSSF